MTDEQRPSGADADWRRVHLWQIQAVRDAVLIACAVGLVWLGSILSIVTVPLLLALTLAYLVEPLIVWLTTRFRFIGRKAAVLGLLLALLLAVATGLLLVAPPMIRQATQFIANSGRYVEKARTMAESSAVPEWLHHALAPLLELLPAAAPDSDGSAPTPSAATTTAPPPPTRPSPPSGTGDEERLRELIREELARTSATAGTGGNVLQRLAAGAGRAFALLGSLLGGVVGVALSLVLSTFCFVYFSMAFPAMRAFGASLLPAAGRSRTLELIGMMDHTISAFVRGRLLMAAIVGLIYAVGWSLCGVPNGMFLGLMVGCCSLVPYLAVIGLPLAWVLLAVESSGATTAGFYVTIDPATGAAAMVWWKILFFPLLVNFTAQTLEDYVLTPLIQGKATNLHPVVILLAALAGGALAGFYGLLLAVPVAACLRILISEEFLPRLRRYLAGDGPSAATAAGPPPP